LCHDVRSWGRTLQSLTARPVRHRPLPNYGHKAAWRYVEFFTANIRNPDTRRAHLRACNRFLGWSEDRGLTLSARRPHDVATYIEELQAAVQAPSVKQQLAAIRMLFNWLVTRPGRADQPGGRGARSEARRQDWEEAGARGRCLAHAAQLDPDRHIAGFARPGADRDIDLLVCAHHRGAR
jgi:hypothetical protein